VYFLSNWSFTDGRLDAVPLYLQLSSCNMHVLVESSPRPKSSAVPSELFLNIKYPWEQNLLELI